MAKQLFTNFARTTLSAGIGSGDTSFTVVDGSKFSSPTAGDWQVFVIDNGTTFEVCHLTTRSGNTFSVVVRGRESSSASAFSSGASVIAPVTAAFTNPLAEIDLTTSLVINALPATKGGTGQTSYATGDTLYASAANVLSKLAIGATNAIFTITAGIPAWTTTPTIDTMTLVTALKGSATNPASAGIVRLANAQILNWRNNGNSADLGMTLDASDVFKLPATTLRIANNKQLLARNAADSGDINIVKVNGTDRVQLGNAATDKFGVGGDPTFLLHVLGSFGLKIQNITSGPTTVGDATLVTADATAGAFTINLPTVGTNSERLVVCIKIDASGNAVTFSGNGVNINGAASVSLAAQYNVAMVFGNGTQWYRIV
jgi:hypothetical protein